MVIFHKKLYDPYYNTFYYKNISLLIDKDIIHQLFFYKSRTLNVAIPFL